MSPVTEAHAINPRVERTASVFSPTISVPKVWTPEVETSIQEPSAVDAFLRRGANVAAALVLLVLASPVMLIVALLVRITSPGPVIYVQTRVGLDRRRGEPTLAIQQRRRIDYGGRLFRIYKFRTMRYEETADQRWARRGDPRITPIGHILRKYRLDELPQLLNVLKGDMNLVGPRPEQPKLFVELRDQVPGYADRQKVLPGITGWAQVNHGYDACLEDVQKKVQYDLEYIRRQSAVRDILILLRTVPVIVFRKGAV